MHVTFHVIDAMTTFSTTRLLATSPASIFNAIKNADRLAKWWGPIGFSNLIEVFEFHPGGKWVFTMVGPDGKHYPNEAVFSGIDDSRKVVIRHTNQPHFELTITLEPTPAGTLLRWNQTFDDASVAQAIRHIVVPANEQNLDRLSVELGLAQAARSPFIHYRIGFAPSAQDIVRVFNASGIVRPTTDLERIEKMFANANLIVTAWDGDTLVGVCRALTDFSYCCYLSDLAVVKSHQKQGIGHQMVDKVKYAIGEQVALILLSAETAMSYYPAIGFDKIENGFIIKRKS